MKTAIKIGMMGLSIVLLAGCKEKSHQTEMPAPSISVAMPVVRDITLTKDYPGYLSSDRMVNLVARERISAILATRAGRQSEERRPDIRDRTGSVPK